MNIAPRRLRTTLAVTSTLGLALMAAAPSTASPGDPGPAWHEATIQSAPKDSVRTGPNPYLSFLPDESTADYAAWDDVMGAGASQRSSSAATMNSKARVAGRALPAALTHAEREPAGVVGENDTQATAEQIAGLGTGRKANPRVTVTGSLAAIAPPTPTAIPPAPEDNGSIPLAHATGLTGRAAVTTTGVLGDGPHGPAPAGDGSNDFNFYSLTGTAGFALTVSTEGTPAGTDTVVGLYDAEGTLLAVDDDGGATGLSSLLTHQIATTGTYYVVVAGFRAGGPLPRDPFDSGSGSQGGRGGGDLGNYTLLLRAAQVDADFYAVNLAKGDVLGATVDGSADSLTVFRPDGTQMVGGDQTDASFLFPPESPLPGGGNTTISYVTEESGWYAIAVEEGAGPYTAGFELYRPGSETESSREGVQTVFLDFDGERVNTGTWGGAGVRDLSPLRSFLTRWGLTAADEADVIRMITEETRENIQRDLVEKGLNDHVEVNVVSSSEAADPFGRPNVSRVIVGGTIAESGISTIGIAQFIDPGNYAHEDGALVLLDVMSNPSGSASLNTYLRAQSDRKAFVAQAVGNVVAHEVGHLVGNYHTWNANDVTQLMDAGGASFDELFGVGPDGVGGTADDTDVDFEEDVYSPPEGFTGLEDTLNVASWAYVKAAK
ncbi:hypothetical protein N802_03315 [Knoellia sinensis KCTC 19936]|uniref:Peptidase C-terminal archaeal/bacterial domain-containing protein n=1 Tax=Knoellia sinensis KCTC 19936 TaxID=1385520 RepID=A0A0A0J6N8_9MICO|nr:PPC domain-containing protein [Knoellia sinensis]KGN31737.1 hypothetical protein N802_03315 [Knoellia sinensis KCTC 19936]